MIKKLLKDLAPVAALALGAMAAGCGEMNVSFGEGDGVPLSELDMSGPAPRSLVLASPDSVVVTRGDRLAITVEGDADATEAMRFSLDDDTLAISREKDARQTRGRATIRVTMPSLHAIVLAGSGGIAAQSMAGNAEVTIAGSGRVDVATLQAQKLDVNLAGSGTFAAGGSAERLDLTVAGSGTAEMDELQVERADVNIMGSGEGAFASDGSVEANIMGSGEVTVFGRASCTINSMGSGKLNCRDANPADGSEARTEPAE
ncbi:MAG: head GIN domain-containing protein [Qipengyuania sp.]